MNRIVRFGGVLLSTSLILSGCRFTASEVDAPVVVDDLTPVAERLEAFESYTKTSNANIAKGNELGLANCQKHSEFEQEVQQGDVEKLVLYMKDGYHLEVYKTTNYRNLTNPMLSDYNTKCAQGTDALRILKAFPEVLIWGQPSCIAPAAPNSNDPTYQSFLDCQAVAEDLQEYIAS